MSKNKKATETWTRKKILAYGKKCRSRTEFYHRCPGAARASKRLGCFDSATKHLQHKVKPNGYWTLERIFKTAKQYQTRFNFQIKAKGAYLAARRRGVLDQACKHM